MPYTKVLQHVTQSYRPVRFRICVCQGFCSNIDTTYSHHHHHHHRPHVCFTLLQLHHWTLLCNCLWFSFPHEKRFRCFGLQMMHYMPQPRNLNPADLESGAEDSRFWGIRALGFKLWDSTFESRDLLGTSLRSLIPDKPALCRKIRPLDMGCFVFMLEVPNNTVSGLYYIRVFAILTRPYQISSGLLPLI